MSKFEEDFKDFEAKLIPARLKYKLQDTSSNKIAVFKLASITQIPSDNIIKHAANTTVSYSSFSKSLVTRFLHKHTTANNILDDIKNFILKNDTSPNPSLTRCFRYYRDEAKLDDDLYITWKYMINSDRSEQHITNILNILELLMKRNKNG